MLYIVINKYNDKSFFMGFRREFSYFSLVHNILRVENIYRSYHNITNDSFKKQLKKDT